MRTASSCIRELLELNFKNAIKFFVKNMKFYARCYAYLLQTVIISVYWKIEFSYVCIITSEYFICTTASHYQYHEICLLCYIIYLYSINLSVSIDNPFSYILFVFYILNLDVGILCVRFVLSANTALFVFVFDSCGLVKFSIGTYKCMIYIIRHFIKFRVFQESKDHKSQRVRTIHVVLK